MISFIEPHTLLKSKDASLKETPVRLKTNTQLQRFYRGTSIFITGGSGFMGKVLTEKLLRCFPEVDTIYLLMREKRGKTVEERLDAIFDDALFLKLRLESPKFREKIRAVTGDCSLPGLGLSDEQRHLLTQNVNIVFHGAATVRFDEKLKVAVTINVCGTRDVLRLAKKMDNLKAILYLSTAYCNCPQPEINEKFYEPTMPYEKLLQMVGTCPDSALETATPMLLDKWPNTYTLTKAVAEDVIRKEGPGLPIAVFRPSIVVSISRDPLPGWTDNMYGPTGVVVGAGTGVLRSLNADPDVIADMVPVDMAISAMIAAAWDVGTNKREPTADAIPIYNYVSSCEQPINWRRFNKFVLNYGLEIPPMKSVWCLSFAITKHYWVHYFRWIFLHTLTALVVDSLLYVAGKEPQLGKIYKKVGKFSEVIRYFSTRTWKFSNDNVQALWLKLSDEEDREDFMFDMQRLDWKIFFHNYVRGARVFLLKDDLSTLPQARKRERKFKFIHESLKITIILTGLFVAWSLMEIVFSLCTA